MENIKYVHRCCFHRWRHSIVVDSRAISFHIQANTGNKSELEKKSSLWSFLKHTWQSFDLCLWSAVALQYCSVLKWIVTKPTPHEGSANTTLFPISKYIILSIGWVSYICGLKKIYDVAHFSRKYLIFLVKHRVSSFNSQQLIVFGKMCFESCLSKSVRWKLVSDGCSAHILHTSP